MATANKKYYDDDDDYTSSYDSDYTSTDSDNSEEFRPLELGFVKGGAVRRTGKTSENRYTNQDSAPSGSDSDDDLSLSEVPLQVSLGKSDIKRHAGQVVSSKPNCAYSDSTSDDDDESDSVASHEALVATIGNRPQRASAVRPKGPKPQSVMDAQVSVSDMDSDSDAAAMNAEIVANLVRRIRQNPNEDIPLEAFQCVNWDDDNMREALAPLRIIYEAKSHSVQSMKSRPTVARQGAAQQAKAAPAQVKEAMMSLPAERQIEVMVARVKAKNIKPSSDERKAPTQKDLRSAENGEAILKLVRELKLPTQNVSTAAFKEIDWNDPAFKDELAPLKVVYDSLEAKEVAVKGVKASKMSTAPQGAGKSVEDRVQRAIMSLPEEKAVAAKVDRVKQKVVQQQKTSSKAPKQRTREKLMEASMSQIERAHNKGMSAAKSNQKVKENVLHEAETKPKRKRVNPNRSGVSFTDVAPPEVDEIVEDDEGLQGGMKASDMQPAASRAAGGADGNGSSRKKRSHRDGIARKKRTARPGSSVSFSAMPEDEAAEGIDEKDTDPAKRKPKTKRRGRRDRGGRNVSFSGIPDELDAEELVEDNTELGAAGARPRKARATGKHRGSKHRNRSCSFLDVDLNEGAGEIVEDDKTTGVGKAAPGTTAAFPSSRTRGTAPNEPSSSAQRRRTSQVRRKHSRGELSISALPEETGTEMDDFLTDQGGKGRGDQAAARPTASAAKRRKERRRLGHSLSISAVPDEDVAGEIREEGTDSLAAPPSNAAGGRKGSTNLPTIAGAGGQRRSLLVNQSGASPASSARKGVTTVPSSVTRPQPAVDPQRKRASTDVGVKK